MVIREAVRRAHAAPSLRSSLTISLAINLTCALLAAQDAAPAPAAEPAYGRIVADEVRLRCWSGAVAAPPLFEDTLAKDTIVQLGRSENGFRAVLLPLGPIGYVSSKFADVAADGQVTSKGIKVSFRYRPRTSDAPVAQLADKTPLAVIGEQDEWLRARVEGVEAWVAEAEVQVLDAADPLAANGDAELRARHAAEVQARLDKIAAEAAQAKQDEIDLAAVKVVEEAFAAELRKPVEEQRFEALVEALGKLEATLAEGSGAKTAVAALHKRIDTQRWIAEAVAVRNSTPPVEPAPPPPPRDTLERFQSIGWLRYERRLGAPGIYYLEKGGRRQHLLSCNTGRYDLSLFVGREVGVIGPRRQPLGESLGVLDVERLEVLGSPPR